MHRLRKEAALGWLGACALSIVGFAAEAGNAVEFDELDGNGDGYLSAGECRHLPELHALIPDLDRDGDGRLDAREFQYFQDRSMAPPTEGVPSFIEPGRVYTKAI